MKRMLEENRELADNVQSSRHRDTVSHLPALHTLCFSFTIAVIALYCFHHTFCLVVFRALPLQSSWLSLGL